MSNIQEGEHIFRSVKSEYLDAQIDIFALDYYMKDRGEDDFSRKQVWFYVYGDEELEEEFVSRTEDLIQKRFVEDSIDWDLITLCPTHVENSFNPHMMVLCEKVSKTTGIEFRNVLTRTHNVLENHEIESVNKKMLNLADSLESEDVEGKNIILVDNISLTGSSLLHGKKKLEEAGAANVASVCLGIGNRSDADLIVDSDETISEVVQNQKPIDIGKF